MTTEMTTDINTPEGFEFDAPSCSSGEPFALMVLGQSMTPEFNEGEIIIIEPDGLAKDGSYVLVQQNDEYTFRQLVKVDKNTAVPNQWTLHALNPAFPDEALADFTNIKGVIIQKALPGRRRASKFYV